MWGEETDDTRTPHGRGGDGWINGNMPQPKKEWPRESVHYIGGMLSDAYETFRLNSTPCSSTIIDGGHEDDKLRKPTFRLLRA